MAENIVIRKVEISDVEHLVEIYRPYVENTAITFEYDVPDMAEFAGRIENITKKYPYLVAVHNGEIVGYTYASTFKDRRAYDWAVETSVYLKMGERGHGIGTKLYRALEQELIVLGIKNMYACIAWIDETDEYLDHTSVLFHKYMGFENVGTFHKCGYKFDRWYDMVWMEKMI